MDGTPSLVAWALHYANKSRSNWKRTSGREIAIWLCMESVCLGLLLESEIGFYSEEIYVWHNRPGPINKRPGVRTMEVFGLYLGFKVPWWNEVVPDPKSRLPKTMAYLKSHFSGDDLVFRRHQIARGLKKGHNEMMKMTTKYFFKSPLLYLLLAHQAEGKPFLRALLSIFKENPAEGVMLIHEAE